MGPGSAWFLTEQERSHATTRIKIDVARYVQHSYGEDGLEKSDERLSKRDMIETGKDWKLWYALFFNICASIPGQAFSVFLPLVVQGLGYTSITANLVRNSEFHLRSLLTNSDVCATICVRRRGVIHICFQLGPTVRSRPISINLKFLTVEQKGAWLSHCDWFDYLFNWINHHSHRRTHP